MQTDQGLDVEAILADLQHYRPRRKGWVSRRPDGSRMGPFAYEETSVPLLRSVPLPAAHYFGDIDPQPDCTITSEIASGRFEDDLRRMRMVAWHGADHIMVIRTAGQSHIDGLIEGTPEGVGGVPITRKQLRATRKALDMIEDEVGRPINLHSYVSGLAGPEMAVLFADEGVGGAHQDPQYNVLYRNVNMVRSFVDAAEAKFIMAQGGIIQIDGAHNANATARKAWKVMPEIIVQHAINGALSELVGFPRDRMYLSTVPPTAPPAPSVRLDLPYAVALRQLFEGYRFRAQMNTRYIESDSREATVTHVLDVLISRLTSADIQSTITPDEGRNVPWHQNSVAAVDTAKQALVGLDGLNDLVALDMDGPLGHDVRDIQERALLFLEEILEVGGYFSAVAKGFFVDSGLFPEREGDGIPRDPDGGVGAHTVVRRDSDYLAPVCFHFGNNATDESPPCSLIGGCTICCPEKIAYVDELDLEDNVSSRLAENKEGREKGLIRPEVQWYADGYITLSLLLPCAQQMAGAVALSIAGRLGLEDTEVIHSRVMHPAEGTWVELKARVPWGIDASELKMPIKDEILSEQEIREAVLAHPLRVVAATAGKDEHSVGMREILDIKHGGLEKFGISARYLGTSVPVQKMIDAAIEIDADAVLMSTIITHADIHRENMKRLANYATECGVRHRLILVAGGTQVTADMARECGLDGGFGRGTKGVDVASFLVKQRRLRGTEGRR